MLTCTSYLFMVVYDVYTCIVTVVWCCSCDPTQWRQQSAMPFLERAGISYYNPQVADWHPGLLDEENRAKATAAVLLFVIDNDTRALMSMLEAVEFITAGRQVVLAIAPIKEGQTIAGASGASVSAGECKDLNRARTYLGDVAKRHAVQVHESVEGAIKDCAHRAWVARHRPQPLTCISNEQRGQENEHGEAKRHRCSSAPSPTLRLDGWRIAMKRSRSTIA